MTVMVIRAEPSSVALIARVETLLDEDQPGLVISQQVPECKLSSCLVAAKAF